MRNINAPSIILSRRRLLYVFGTYLPMTTLTSFRIKFTQHRNPAGLPSARIEAGGKEFIDYLTSKPRAGYASPKNKNICVIMPARHLCHKAIGTKSGAYTGDLIGGH